MPLKKGQTNNPHGRPTDPNVSKLRETVRGRLLERVDKLFEILDGLTGTSYAEYYLKISKEVMPPMAADITPEQAETAIVSLFDKFQKYPAKTG